MHMSGRFDLLLGVGTLAAGLATIGVALATPVHDTIELTTSDAQQIGFKIKHATEYDRTPLLGVIAPPVDPSGCVVWRAVQATYDAADRQISIISVELNPESAKVDHHVSTIEGYTTHLHFDYRCEDTTIASYEIIDIHPAPRSP